MGTATTAIELASAVKEGYESHVYRNARRAVLEALCHGVRHVLAFADVDTNAELRGVRPVLRLREESRGTVDMQVVAFPQDGLLRDPGAEECEAFARHSPPRYVVASGRLAAAAQCSTVFPALDKADTSRGSDLDPRRD